MKELWLQRKQIKTCIRNFFDSKGYLEIETPHLVACPGVEVHLNFFDSYWKDLKGKKHQRYLRTSPEIHMKRALSLGIDNIYQFSSSFRNGGELGTWHNPEFSMLEWYSSELDFDQMIEQTRGLIEACLAIFPAPDEGAEPKIGFQSFRVADIFQKLTTLELNQEDEAIAQKAIAAGHLSIQPGDSFETVFFKLMIDIVEPELQKLGLCVLYDYPASTAALAKIENGWARRFEFYWNGVELCNGFQELVGEEENRFRFMQVNRMRIDAGHTQIQTDENFLSAMSQLDGNLMGNALGLDRLHALLLNKPNLDDVIAFRSDYLG